MSEVMCALPKDHPLVRAFEAYKASDDYQNTFKWAAHEQHRDGSLWAAFERGWRSRPGQWNTADERPPVHVEVMLFRTYDDLKLKTQTGFRSYGHWDGERWYDAIFKCHPNDVKWWHALPPLPKSENDGEGL